MGEILIVEDESVIRAALKRLLERNNYKVTEAESVSEASENDLSRFDLIISDLRLPGAPGTDHNRSMPLTNRLMPLMIDEFK